MNGFLRTRFKVRAGLCAGWLGLLVGLAFWLGALPERASAATTVTYTVDSTRSSLTISGTYAGNALQPQTGLPGSLTTFYAGTITASRDFTGNTLQILGGTVEAETNGTFSPVGVAHLGTVDHAPADYAFTSQNGVQLFTGALLDFGFSLNGPLVSAPGNLDTTEISAIISSGAIDFAYADPGTFGGSYPIGGGLSLASEVGSVAAGARIETLTIPITTSFSFTADGKPLRLDFSGTIVAATAVPEPASLAVLAIAAIASFCGRRQLVSS